MAHLSPEFGGRGIAALQGGQRALAESLEQLLFVNKDDPDYQKMLRAFEEGNQIMQNHPEADMPGFQQARPEP